MNELQKISEEITAAIEARDVAKLKALRTELLELEAEGYEGCTELLASMVPQDLAAELV